MECDTLADEHKSRSLQIYRHIDNDSPSDALELVLWAEWNWEAGLEYERVARFPFQPVRLPLDPDHSDHSLPNKGPRYFW